MNIKALFTIIGFITSILFVENKASAEIFRFSELLSQQIVAATPGLKRASKKFKAEALENANGFCNTHFCGKDLCEKAYSFSTQKKNWHLAESEPSIKNPIYFFSQIDCVSNEIPNNTEQKVGNPKHVALVRFDPSTPEPSRTTRTNPLPPWLLEGQRFRKIPSIPQITEALETAIMRHDYRSLRFRGAPILYRQLVRLVQKQLRVNLAIDFLKAAELEITNTREELWKMEDGFRSLSASLKSGPCGILISDYEKKRDTLEDQISELSLDIEFKKQRLLHKTNKNLPAFEQKQFSGCLFSDKDIDPDLRILEHFRTIYNGLVEYYDSRTTGKSSSSEGEEDYMVRKLFAIESLDREGILEFYPNMDLDLVLKSPVNFNKTY